MPPRIDSTGINGINIGSDGWFDWLAINKSFRYIPDQTEKFLLFPITVRDRGDGYWYAYRKFNGKQKQKYVGKIGDVDYDRLQVVAACMSMDSDRLKLAQRLAGTKTGVQKRDCIPVSGHRKDETKITQLERERDRLMAELERVNQAIAAIQRRY